MNELDIKVEELRMERELRAASPTTAEHGSDPVSAARSTEPLTPGEFRLAEALLVWSRSL